MAEDEDERRKRRREREDELDNAKESLKPSIKQTTKPGGKQPEQSFDISFEDLVAKANAQIDQVSALYNMFFAGAATLPPIENRAQLEATMKALQAAHKVTPAASFRFNTIVSRFTTYKDRWDKQLKSLEGGKIKRAPPKF